MVNFRLENKDQEKFEIKLCYQGYIIFVIITEFRASLEHNIFLLTLLSTLFFD